MTWEPISTAPKDRKILIKGQDYCYSKYNDLGYYIVPHAEQVYIVPAEYFQDEDGNGFDYRAAGIKYRPTHWKLMSG